MTNADTKLPINFRIKVMLMFSTTNLIRDHAMMERIREKLIM